MKNKTHICATAHVCATYWNLSLYFSFLSFQTTSVSARFLIGTGSLSFSPRCAWRCPIRWILKSCKLSSMFPGSIIGMVLVSSLPVFSSVDAEDMLFSPATMWETVKLEGMQEDNINIIKKWLSYLFIHIDKELLVSRIYPVTDWRFILIYTNSQA